MLKSNTIWFVENLALVGWPAAKEASGRVGETQTRNDQGNPFRRESRPLAW